MDQQPRGAPSRWRPEEASPDEGEAIAHLNLLAFREFMNDMEPESWTDLVRRLTSTGRAPGAVFLVVRDTDGELVGSVLYRSAAGPAPSVPAGSASFDLLAVNPDMRRLGIGTTLVLACLARTASEGAEELSSGKLDPVMVEAGRLLERLAFHREAGIPVRSARGYARYHRKPRSLDS